MRKLMFSLPAVLLAAAFLLTAAVDGHAQGKGKGGGQGSNKGGSSASQGRSDDKGKPDDRDLWDGSDDKNKGKGSGKNDDGLSGRDNRYKGLSKKLGMSPEAVRDWYELEKTRNPDLNYGRFVAANMISKNARKKVSTDDILEGLRRGDSIGQVLQRSGWSDRDIRNERDRIRRVMRDEGYDYVDRAEDWILNRK